MSMPTGLRQLRRKLELEVCGDENEDENEEAKDEWGQENMLTSVGKRYTNVQEDWLLYYVANNTNSGRRKDAFAIKFGS